MVRNTPRVVCVQQCVAAERTSLVSYNMKDKHVHRAHNREQAERSCMPINY